MKVKEGQWRITNFDSDIQFLYKIIEVENEYTIEFKKYQLFNNKKEFLYRGITGNYYFKKTTKVFSFNNTIKKL